MDIPKNGYIFLQTAGKEALMDSPAAFVIAFAQKIAKGSYCPFHAHGGVEIVFHPYGEGSTACSDGVKLDFAPGDAIVYPPGVQHDQTTRCEGADNCLQIGVRDAAAFPGLGKALRVRSLHSRTALAELAELSSWSDESPRAAKDLRAAALLLTLLHEAARQSLGEPEPGLSMASEARAIAASELAEPPSAAQIARRVGLSPDHLRHLVLKHFGKGLKEISLEARTSRAMSLLDNSPMTLKEIAAETGFANERALCAAFKLRTGSTPGQFRNKAGEGS